MALLTENYGNAAIGKLQSSITSTDLSITLQSGYGAQFPAAPFRATLFGSDIESGTEIVVVEGKSGDTLTVASGGRGAEGTTAQSWGAGDNIQQLITAGMITDIVDEVNDKDGRLDAIEADDWVTEDRIADDAVSADKIAAGAVDGSKIGAGAVTADKIGAGAVTAEKIGAGAVGTSAIGNLQVTAAKLSGDVISTGLTGAAGSAIAVANPMPTGQAQHKYLTGNPAAWTTLNISRSLRDSVDLGAATAIGSSGNYKFFDTTFTAPYDGIDTIHVVGSLITQTTTTPTYNDDVVMRYQINSGATISETLTYVSFSTTEITKSINASIEITGTVSSGDTLHVELWIDDTSEYSMVGSDGPIKVITTGDDLGLVIYPTGSQPY